MTPRVFLDCGAYSARHQGGHVDLDEYCRFIDAHHGQYEVCAALDVIPDRSLGPEEVERAAIMSYRNFRAMRDRCLSPLPVFHMGERWYWLRRLIVEGERRIAVSVYGTTFAQEQWLGQLFSVTEKAGVRVHGSA